MKNLHKLEFLGLFDNFRVKLKRNFLSKVAHIPSKSLQENAFSCCWTFSEFWSMKRLKFLQKLRWKIQKCKKSKICWLFRGPCCNFFYKTAFISANNPIGQRNQSLLIVFNVLIHEISRNLTKVAQKGEKLVHFEVFVIFGALFVRFFSSRKLCLHINKSLLDNEFVPCWTSFIFKQPNFSKSTQKLHKVFKNLYFWYFCQFRSEFDAFSQHKLLLPLQKKNPDNKLFPWWTSVRF